MKWFVLIAICIALFVSGCKNEEEQTPPVQGATEDLLPMAKGNKWVWVGGFPPATGDTITWQVADKRVRNNGELAWDIHIKKVWKDRPKPVPDSANILTRPGLVLMYMDVADPDADTVLSYPLTKGKEWTVTLIQSWPALRTSRVIGREDVTTPYGVFKNALRIDSKDIGVENDSTLMEMSDWYIKDVGKVMSRVKARGQVWEMKLLTAELH